MVGRLVQWLILAGLLVPLLAAGALAEQQPASGLKVPSDQALTIMIKSILITYNDANLSGNYSVLRDLASPAFREANSPSALAEIFKDNREKNINIAPILLFQPKLLRKPEIDADGDLVLEGFFDTRPDQVRFLIVYRAVEGAWQLFALRVTAKTVEAVAPAEAAPSPSQPKPEPTPEKSKPGGNVNN
jgi:hypothetical protein